MSDDDLTLPAGAGATRSVTPFVPRTPGPPPTSSFTPGAIIAGRYRLVAMLGRGGMGEVYRADDLTLDQPVALKFLAFRHADSGGNDALNLAQFHNELRVARQVSHKNVVRLYDLGEADGRRFLTMEYVDGEDLGSLLRRIGRFPEDRAVAIARQLCAGVSAAHERGVIHRDLKPANVMIDGEGDVRITDFGIATAGADAGGGLAGTPQYMAPEQLKGQPASTRSDIYALGLILFEIFTGKRAHEAKTINELKALHDTGTIATPSTIVRELDPTIERVILRCLDRDPAKRPASALAVAAALPGGDPVAAALAAGETPSPEMLAAAGERDTVAVGPALAMFAVVVAGILVTAALAPRASIAGRVPLDKPPAALADRAQQIARSLGYTDAVTDSASNFSIAGDYLRWVTDHDPSPRRWDALATGVPPSVLFWHRTSPRLLVPTRPALNITTADPPLAISGMTLVILDTEGRLQEFHAVPPQFDGSIEPPPAPNWRPLFEAAGLPFANFTAVPPQWTPRDFGDTRAAWEGPLDKLGAGQGLNNVKIRIEAAAYRGRAISFLTVGPWSTPSRMLAVTSSSTQRALSAVVAALLFGIVITACVVARFNMRARRADTRGASRLAVFVIAGYVLTYVMAAHHVPDVSLEINYFLRDFGGTLIAAASLWVMYLALEPYVRRFWPDGILGWTRLVSGHIRDPRVGRDVLIGSLFAVYLALAAIAYFLLPARLGLVGPTPLFQNNVTALNGIAGVSSSLFGHVVGGLFVAMFSVLGFVLMRLLFRRAWIATLGLVVAIALVQAPSALSSGTSLGVAVAFQAVIVVVMVTMLVRYGLLATAVAFALGRMIDDVPLRLSLSHWTTLTSNLTIGIMLAVACFGFYASRAGQPLFGKWDA